MSQYGYERQRSKYPDEGCNLRPSCLGCTLPRCKDDVGRMSHKETMKRNIEIVRLGSEGVSTQQIADQFYLKPDTIKLILRNHERKVVNEKSLSLGPK